MKEQIQELKERAASQSDTAKKMEEFVEVKVKGKVNAMKAEVAESLDIEQRKSYIIMHRGQTKAFEGRNEDSGG